MKLQNKVTFRDCYVASDARFTLKTKIALHYSSRIKVTAKRVNVEKTFLRNLLTIDL